MEIAEINDVIQVKPNGGLLDGRLGIVLEAHNRFILVHFDDVKEKYIRNGDYDIIGKAKYTPRFIPMD